MPKFKVDVTVTATTQYQVEVEADDQTEAEEVATSRSVALSSVTDFDVDLGDCTYECETFQLTFACSECGAAIGNPNKDYRYSLSKAEQDLRGYMYGACDKCAADLIAHKMQRRQAHA